MRRFILACALAIAAVLRVYSIASAHVTLVSSEPAAGSTLAAAPSRVRLEFSEPVEAKMVKISIVRADGRTTDLTVANDPRNAYVLLAPLSALDAGGYRVMWHVVSADGHPVMGSFVFTVGAAMATPAETPPVPDSVSTVGPSIAGAPTIASLLRGLGVGALAGLAGLLFFAVMMHAASDSRSLRVALWLSIASVVLLGAHLVVWLMNAAPDHRLTA
ncbi:MAG TPA: copper resistance CopC family protein, partial [Gemmatimonadaceae bacterium]